MSQNMLKPIAPNKTEVTKSIITISIILAVVNILFSLFELPYSKLIPSTLLLSSYIISFFSFGMLLYGLRLSRTYKSKYQLGLFISIWMVFTSIQFFLASNIFFLADLNAGQINETVNYFKLSLITYFSMSLTVVMILSILFSPRLLFRENISITMNLLSGIIGLVLIIATYIIMSIIMYTYFTNPETVKSVYRLLIASVYMGYSSLFLLILLKRLNGENTNSYLGKR